MSSLQECLSLHVPPEQHETITQALAGKNSGHIGAIESAISEYESERANILTQARSAKTLQPQIGDANYKDASEQSLHPKPLQEQLPGVGAPIVQPGQKRYPDEPKLNPETNFIPLSKLDPGDMVPQVSSEQMLRSFAQNTPGEAEDQYNTARAMEAQLQGNTDLSEKYVTAAAGSRAFKRVMTEASKSVLSRHLQKEGIVESPLFAEFFEEERAKIKALLDDPQLPEYFEKGSTNPSYQDLFDTSFDTLKLADTFFNDIPFADPMVTRKRYVAENLVSGALTSSAGYLLVGATPFASVTKPGLFAASALGGAENMLVTPLFDKAIENDPENAGWYIAAQFITSLGLGASVEPVIANWYNRGVHWLYTSPAMAQYNPIRAWDRVRLEAQTRWLQSGMITDSEHNLRRTELIRSIQDSNISYGSQIDVGLYAARQDAQEALLHNHNRYFSIIGDPVTLGLVEDGFEQSFSAYQQAKKQVHSLLYSADKTGYERDINARVGELREIFTNHSFKLLNYSGNIAEANLYKNTPGAALAGIDANKYRENIIKAISYDMDLDIDTAEALYTLGRPFVSGQDEDLLKSLAKSQIDKVYKQTEEQMIMSQLAATMTDQDLFRGPFGQSVYMQGPINARMELVKDQVTKVLANREASRQGIDLPAPEFTEDLLPPEIKAILDNFEPEAGGFLINPIEKSKRHSQFIKNETSKFTSLIKQAVANKEAAALGKDLPFPEFVEARLPEEIHKLISSSTEPLLTEAGTLHPNVQRVLASDIVKSPEYAMAMQDMSEDLQMAAVRLVQQDVKARIAKSSIIGAKSAPKMTLPESAQHLAKISELYDTSLNLERVDSNTLLAGTFPQTISDYNRLVDRAIRIGSKQRMTSTDLIRLGKLLSIDSTDSITATSYNRVADLTNRLLNSGYPEARKMGLKPIITDIDPLTDAVAKIEQINTKGPSGAIKVEGAQLDDVDKILYSNPSVSDMAKFATETSAPPEIKEILGRIQSRPKQAKPTSIEEFLTAEPEIDRVYTEVSDALRRALKKGEDIPGSDAFTLRLNQLKNGIRRDVNTAKRQLKNQNPGISSAELRKQVPLEPTTEQTLQFIELLQAHGKGSELIGKTGQRVKDFLADQKNVLKGTNKSKDQLVLKQELEANKQGAEDMKTLRKWYTKAQLDSLDLPKVEELKTAYKLKASNARAQVLNQIDTMDIGDTSKKTYKDLVDHLYLEAKGDGSLVGHKEHYLKFASAVSDLGTGRVRALDYLPGLLKEVLPKGKDIEVLNHLVNSGDFNSVDDQITRRINAIPREEDRNKLINTWGAIKAGAMNDPTWKTPEGKLLPTPRALPNSPFVTTGEEASEAFSRFEYLVSQSRMGINEIGEEVELPKFGEPADLLRQATIAKFDDAELANWPGDVRSAVSEAQGYVEGFLIPRLKALIGKSAESMTPEQVLEHPRVKGLINADTLVRQFSADAIGTNIEQTAKYLQAAFYDRVNGTGVLMDQFIGLESTRQSQLYDLMMTAQLGKAGLNVDNITPDQINKVHAFYNDELIKLGHSSGQSTIHLQKLVPTIKIKATDDGRFAIDIPDPIRRYLDMTGEVDLKNELRKIYPSNEQPLDEATSVNSIEIESGATKALHKILGVFGEHSLMGKYAAAGTFDMPPFASILATQPVKNDDFRNFAAKLAKQPGQTPISNFRRNALAKQVLGSGGSFSRELSNVEVQNLVDYRSGIKEKLFNQLKDLELFNGTGTMTHNAELYTYGVMARKAALLLRSIDDTLEHGSIAPNTMDALRLYNIDMGSKRHTLASFQRIIKDQMFDPVHDGTFKSLSTVNAKDIHDLFQVDAGYLQALQLAVRTTPSPKLFEETTNASLRDFAGAIIASARETGKRKHDWLNFAPNSDQTVSRFIEEMNAADVKKSGRQPNGVDKEVTSDMFLEESN